MKDTQYTDIVMVKASNLMDQDRLDQDYLCRPCISGPGTVYVHK